MSKIVCLGWGSLIWDPRCLPISSHEWHKDGPKLPLEFARKSTDGRMTLVVCKHGTCCPTLWNTLECTSLEKARSALAKREGMNCKDAAYWLSSEASDHSDHFGVNIVGVWAKKHGFAGVVWTGLPPKSPVTKKNGDYPSIEDVICHLSKLDRDAAKKAEEYVRKAPEQISTAYRSCIVEKFGWH